MGTQMRFVSAFLAFVCSVLVAASVRGAVARPHLVRSGIASQHFHSLAFGDSTTAETALGVSYANTAAKDIGFDAGRVVRHGFIPMVIYWKDTNENPACVQYIDLYHRQGGSRTLVQRVAQNVNINNDQQYFFGGFAVSDFPGAGIGDTLLFEVETAFRDGFFCTASHLNHYFCRVTVGEPLPSLQNWYRTDTHYHTRFSDNVFEFGGFMWMVREVADASDIDVVCITDHSTDIKTGNSVFSWNQLVREADSLSTGGVLLIPGEELTVDSDEQNQFPDNRIHLLGIGLHRPLLAPEECCAQNSSTALWTLRRALDSLTVQNAVAMAAHPVSSFSVGFGGQQALWSNANWQVAFTYPAFMASEFYNERKTVFNNTGISEDFVYPYGWAANPNWDAKWQEGFEQFLGLAQQNLAPVRKLGLAGGSDAHGDFCFKTTNQYGTIDMAANDDALGVVHTLVYSPGGLTRDGILTGMRNFAMVMSDGPAFTVWVDSDGDGLNDGTIGGLFALANGARLQLEGASIPEFGSFTLARLIHVTRSSRDTTTIGLSGLNLNQLVDAYQFAALGEWSGHVVEVQTANGYRAVTSPIWIAPQVAVSVDSLLATSLSLSPARPNPSHGSVSFAITVPTALEGRIEILDLSGRRVKAYNLGMLQPGTVSFHWDGRDEEVKNVSTGVYFVRFTAGDEGVTHRIVLLR